MLALAACSAVRKSRRTVNNQRPSDWLEHAARRRESCPIAKSNYSKAPHAYEEIGSARTNQRESTEENHPQVALALIPALYASLREPSHSLPNVKDEPHACRA